MNKFKILLIGTQKFAYIQFKKIIKNYKKNIIAIITKKGNNYTEYLAKKKKIKLFQIKNKKEMISLFKKKIIKLNIDLIILIEFGIILPKFIIKIPRLGCYNVHPSLLPKWKGPSPIQYTLLHGDKKTGITFIKINEKIDEGNIILQKKCNILKNDNYITLYNKLINLSKNIINKIIKKIYLNKIIELKQKKIYKKNYTYKIKKIDGIINWKNTAKKIDRQIKAFYKWPKTFFYYKKYIIFIWKIKIIKKYNNKYKIGEIVSYNSKHLKIQTGKKIIKIIKIQINNKKKMKINKFFNSKPKFFIKGKILK